MAGSLESGKKKRVVQEIRYRGLSVRCKCTAFFEKILAKSFVYLTDCLKSPGENIGVQFCCKKRAPIILDLEVVRCLQVKKS